ncbi:hypothetical protein AB0E62_27330 [Streptomyces sp. NPDC038707]|uniref:hypothetical protein n=1 Tax=Streptomyces sp. NPDC038707 TaxID=3154329 RepID=UPI0033E85852
MGIFSRKADELLKDSTSTGFAGIQADKDGQPVTAGAYRAQSDAKFQQWLDQTEEEWEQRKKNR